MIPNWREECYTCGKAITHTGSYADYTLYSQKPVLKCQECFCRASTPKEVCFEDAALGISQAIREAEKNNALQRPRPCLTDEVLASQQEARQKNNTWFDKNKVERCCGCGSIAGFMCRCKYYHQGRVYLGGEFVREL